MLEKDWQKQVIELATTLGFRYYHTHRSEKSPSGFPDLVLVGRRVVYLELKREKTQPTPAQRDWLTALHDAGAEVYLARPRHLQALTLVLARGDQTARQELLDELWLHVHPRRKEAA